MSETITEVDLHVGKAVTFVDPKARRHDAIVTAVWGQTSKEIRDAALREMYGNARAGGADWAAEEVEQKAINAPYLVPSINVVYTDADEAKSDPYGRQIARSTSVPHRSVQPAHGYYWE